MWESLRQVKALPLGLNWELVRDLHIQAEQEASLPVWHVMVGNKLLDGTRILERGGEIWWVNDQSPAQPGLGSMKGEEF